MTLEQGTERAIPHDLAAEQRVLGALLIDRDAIFKVADLLRAEDFYQGKHQRIYRAAQALLERRERIDPLTMQVELARNEFLDQVGGSAYLRELVESTPTAVDVGRYARVVRDRSLLRRLLGAAKDIAADAYDEPADVTLALDRAEQRIFSLRDDAINGQLRHIQDALLENYDAITERMEHPLEVSGIPSGFREIDHFTEGFTRGDLVIIAARPSVGKTSLGLAIAHHVAKRGTGVLVFSLEMDSKQIVARFLGLNSRTDLLALRTGNIRDTGAAAALAGLPILIDDTPGISIMEIRTKARRAIAQAPGGLGIIVVDYVQLIRTGEHEENRVQELSTITRNLKSLARELDVTIVALSQLSRAAGDAGNEPKLSTLRECVTGDTVVCLADGRRVPIRELVGTTPEVLSIGGGGRVVRAMSDKVWLVGRRAIFEVKLASGRSIRATAEHRLYTFKSWRTVSQLQVDDRLAIARVIPEPMDTIERQSVGVGTTARVNTATRVAEHATLVASEALATTDLSWDRIISIEPAGEEDVYDLTVPATSSWLADGIVSHNSGSLEQDSDVVLMLWKDKDESPPGAPKLIHGSIGKNRNGPTGRFELYFEAEQARFFSRSDEEGMPV